MITETRSRTIAKFTLVSCNPAGPSPHVFTFRHVSTCPIGGTRGVDFLDIKWEHLMSMARGASPIISIFTVEQVERIIEGASYLLGRVDAVVTSPEEYFDCCYDNGDDFAITIYLDNGSKDKKGTAGTGARYRFFSSQEVFKIESLQEMLNGFAVFRDSIKA
jgi:hypothetical protein